MAASPCAPLLNIELRDDQFVVRQAVVGHHVVADWGELARRVEVIEARVHRRELRIAVAVLLGSRVQRRVGDPDEARVDADAYRGPR